MTHCGARFCATIVGFGAIGLGTFANVASASLLAFDNAAQVAYTDGWQPGDNGGSGWAGGWTFRNQSNVILTTTNGNRGWFAASSLGNNSPAGTAGDSNGDFDINTPSAETGQAWGLYSNSTDQVYAIRPFSGALSVGQKVSFDFDNGNIASGQVVGLRLLSNASDIGAREFELRFVGGDPNYSFVANPSQSTTLGFTREGIRAEFALTSASTFELSVTRLQSNVTQNFTGTTVNGLPIVALAFKNQFAGSGAAANGYLNNIAISDVPEPASLGLLALGSLLLARRRRR